MKKIYFGALMLLAMLFTSAGTFAQNEFITKWDTRLTSASGSADNANATIVFGAQGSNFTISYTEVGGSASSGTFTGLNDNPSVTFPEPGVYIVKMSGLTGYRSDISTNNVASYANGLVEIQQWGNTHWTSLYEGFSNCFNMDMTATDAPDLSGVTDLTSLFEECASLINANNSINTWDVSNIRNMYAMFFGAKAFNQPLSNWNTGNVTEMGFMFRDANAFNQNINGWDVSRVTDMYEMFVDAWAFNQPLNKWNTGNVTEMGFMFDDAHAFNQNINNWDVSKVTDMQLMFADARAFNQPLNKWNTGNVTEMGFMFYDAFALNQDISSWNVSSVTDMGGMFENASIFNQDISSWDVSKVTDMSYMFSHASSFDQNLGSWNLSSVTDVTGMLDNSGLSCMNYASTLEGWAASSNTPDNLTLGAAGLSYVTNAQSAHDVLTGTKGWTISDNGVGTCSTLPITLVPGSFKAAIQNNTVLLSWATATEISNKGFNIQHSTDGVTWSAIGTVNSQAANGNSATALQYHFTDNHPANGNNYYRLAQTDLDGTKTVFSQTININFANNIALQVYPNPVTRGASINIGGLTAGAKVAVYNTKGNLVQSFTAASSAQQINTSNLAAGVYFVKVSGGASATFIVK